MKKYSLLKAIGIVVIIFMFLTWIIPTGKFVGGKVVGNGYDPMGLFDLILTPFNFFNWSFFSIEMLPNNGSVIIGYVGNVLALLSIGVFYKVLNKTGAYGNLVSKLSNSLSKHKTKFIIVTMILFTLLSAITGLTLLLFLLVPFFITLLLKLKYTKVAAFATTILPILIGRACSLTAWDITGINNIVYGVSWSTNILYRIIILLIFMILTIVYVVSSKSLEMVPKDKKKKVTIEDPLYDEYVDDKKGYGLLIALTLLFFGIMAICMYNFYYVFDMTAVTDAYDNIVSNTISGYPFVNNLLGNMEKFGYWSGYSMSAMIMILSMILSFLYSVSLDDFIASFKEGIRKMGKVAIYVVLASTIMVFLNESVSNIFYTIAAFINEKITFNTVPFSSLLSGVYSIFINNYYSIAMQTNELLSTYFKGDAYVVSVLCTQLIHGIISILTPTSIFLVAGLSYLDIPYKKWMSYIWKLFLLLLIIGIFILLIISALL